MVAQTIEAAEMQRVQVCGGPSPRGLDEQRGDANPAASAARTLGNYRGTGETVPFVNRVFEWGVVIATFLSILSIVPRHCARLADFFHPKLRDINAVLITLRLIALALRRAVSAPMYCVDSRTSAGPQRCRLTVLTTQTAVKIATVRRGWSQTTAQICNHSMDLWISVALQCTFGGANGRMSRGRQQKRRHVGER